MQVSFWNYCVPLEPANDLASSSLVASHDRFMHDSFIQGTSLAARAAGVARAAKAVWAPGAAIAAKSVRAAGAAMATSGPNGLSGPYGPSVFRANEVLWICMDFIHPFWISPLKFQQRHSIRLIIKRFPFLLQTLSSQSISSSPIFRHFYQVNFSRQNKVNRKDEVGLDIRFSGVQKIHIQMRIWKRLWWWCNMAFSLADTGLFHE